MHLDVREISLSCFRRKCEMKDYLLPSFAEVIWIARLDGTREEVYPGHGMHNGELFAGQYSTDDRGK